MSGVNNGKFVIDFRSSQSSAGAFMHSFVVVKNAQNSATNMLFLQFN